MRPPTHFEALLPTTSDPVKSKFRSKLVSVLNSKGEILPAAKSPLGTLWRLLNSQDSSIEECTEVVVLDAALASRIFRVANSAAYGGRTTNISEAIFHIGFKCLRELVFSAGVLAQFSSLKVPPEWDVFWLRNIFIARLNERISASCFPTDGSEYLAGLIHDIGWLFLTTHFPEEFTMIMISEKPSNEAEREFLPFSHADIAGAISARSSLPLRTINAIIEHHALMVSAEEKMVLAPRESTRFLGVSLSVCDKIADSCQMGLFGQPDPTLEEIQQSTEVQWLKNFGKNFDFKSFIAEELPKSQEIFSIFFTDVAAEEAVPPSI